MKELAPQAERELLKRAAALVRHQDRIDIEDLARKLGVVEIEARAMKVEGYLGVRADGRLVIRYKRGSRKVRRRFTIAHEVGHILINQFRGRRIERPVARARFRDDYEERLANRLAAELLLPEKSLIGELADGPVSWGSIRRISGWFDVSTATLLRRLRELDEVFAIEISTANGVRIAHSPHRRVRFLRRPQDEVASIEIEARARRMHRLGIEVDGDLTEIDCTSRWCPGTTDRYLQIVGWTMQEKAE